MNAIKQIILILLAVHLATVLFLFILKNTQFAEKLRSSSNHPASTGNTAVQLGGFATIPITTFAVIYYVNTLFQIPVGLQMVFCVPLVFLFIIGFIDDIRHISAYFRLTIHLANALSMTIIIFQVTQFSGIQSITNLAGIYLPAIFMLLAITWMINTTNFIDGMDLFLVLSILPGCVLFGFLHFITHADLIISIIFLIFTASLLGFVWFNKPRASIYMGDAGTLCIGFMLGSCGVYILAKYGSIAGFVPFAYILVDTTFTLFSRIKLGKNPLKSHSEHGYQIAKRQGTSDNSIRTSCLIASVSNTVLAYLCFYFDNDLMFQMLFGAVAFALSTYTFLSFKSVATQQIHSQ